MSALIVIGSQWGDEGKGKIVDLLTPNFSAVVRYQGGNNAGHTIIRNGKKFIFQLIPSGIIEPGVTCVIGNGVVLDLEGILAEIENIRQQGCTVGQNFMISDRVQVIFPIHKIIDNLRESKLSDGKIGTTGKGIGPAYEDKVSRRGIRLGEIDDSEEFRKRFFDYYQVKLDYLKDAFDYTESPPVEDVYNDLMKNHQKIKSHIADTAEFLQDLVSKGGKVMLEGAQGTYLDIDHGTYPFVTSSNTTAGGACTGSGLSPRRISHVLGIVKAYTTRVGSGPFICELNDEIGKKLQHEGGEFGSVTGRTRRCGWFDAVIVKQAVQLNGIDSIALMKLDVLDSFPKIKICVAYKDKTGNVLHRLPSNSLEHDGLTPVYEEMDGWMSATTQAKSLDDLPQNCRKYINRIEEICGTPISILSVGPDRNQTIQINSKLI